MFGDLRNYPFFLTRSMHLSTHPLPFILFSIHKNKLTICTISLYSINSRIMTILRKATTRDTTVLRAMRNTTIEHGKTPEWDATGEQAATTKPNGLRMPPTDGRKPFHELRQSTPFLQCERCDYGELATTQATRFTKPPATSCRDAV